MSKWLAAFQNDHRVTDDNCDISDNSPQNGAISDLSSQLSQLSRVTNTSDQHADDDAAIEREAIAQHDGGIPSDWVNGFGRLQAMSPPGDMKPERWNQIINDAGKFLDAWGVQAATVGWNALELFGVDHTKPHARLDQSGLVILICGNAVIDIQHDTASIRHRSGAVNRYSRSASQPGQVPLWECPP